MKRLLSYILWPTLVVGTLALTQYGFGLGYNKIATLALIYIGFAVLVGIIEQVMPHNPDWNLRDGQLAQDHGHTFVGSVIAPRLADGLVLAIMAAPQVWLANAYGGGIWPTEWPMLGHRPRWPSYSGIWAATGRTA